MKRLKNYAARMTRRAGPSTAFRVPSRLFSYALIALLALFAVSCRSTKLTATETLSLSSVSASVDSSKTVVRIVQTESIPADTVRVTVWPDTLARLPTSASYSYKSGRIALKIQKSASGGLLIEATTDSLSRRHSYYEASVTETRQRANSLKNYDRTARRESQSGILRAAGFVPACVIFVALLILAIYFRNKKI